MRHQEQKVDGATDDGNTEDVETNPHFILKPVNISTPMGEVVKFVCEVEGSLPLGKNK